MNYITTDFVYPPIPDRGCDWAAAFNDDWEPGVLIGRGPTEAAAIKDLLEQYEGDEQLVCNMCKNEVTAEEATDNQGMCGPCRSARDEHYRETEQ